MARLGTDCKRPRRATRSNVFGPLIYCFCEQHYTKFVRQRGNVMAEGMSMKFSTAVYDRALQDCLICKEPLAHGLTIIGEYCEERRGRASAGGSARCEDLE